MEPNAENQVVKLRTPHPARASNGGTPAEERASRLPTADAPPAAGSGVERDTAPVTQVADAGACHDSAAAVRDALDHATQVGLSRLTHGLSPAALMNAWVDWSTHMMAAPGKRLGLVEKAAEKGRRFTRYAMKSTASANTVAPCIDALPQDDRFKGNAWQMRPFNLLQQGFLLQQQWWHQVVTDVPGVTAQHERELQFLTRQMLDTMAPSNFPWTNPEVLKKTRESYGMNLVRGMQNVLQDTQKSLTGAAQESADSFLPGRDVAVTKGSVVYRNQLIELIQYAPLTDTVRPEPILIVPAWIMKYYILDLSPQNSMVRYLVEQGHTVFVISWKNPDVGDRDLSLDDYRRLGVMEALEAIGGIVPDQKVHGVGYCLGGTLLSIAAAAMARDGDDRLSSLSLLASQVDFTEPGELGLFINESQLAFLDSVMWKQGYLDTTQMAGAFQMLRSNDLIWSRMVRDYLMGERAAASDLMAWNADATRMPYRMHMEYLRKLYLNNDLAEGRFRVEDRPIHVSDIRVPVFAVGTAKDHVAPWQSVYKIDMLSDTDVTFALTSGGHNAGILSEPGHPRRSFRVRSRKATDLHMDPERWIQTTPEQDGSWWSAWTGWLADRSGAETAPPPMGRKGQAPHADAPGTYIFQK
ncbi:PHA/PHB synthase family protein [Antarcticimicrobium sediminis]|uniref:Alpha/beta fold hydrolase n=1 Tax=Antarcticimicrobium sediminis TaxID=2546227 RepID=A0A4R5ESY1_9RHOB|nr:alpha/beta fold hydrolase [Antarcticimicrobium sediminis]TDE37928.1 alpha/beta fold hydrolase [Antarcticimicrobium sediminis]